MKELEWIKELDEDFKSGDKERFPRRAFITHWENIPATDDRRQSRKELNKLHFLLVKRNNDYGAMRALGEYYLIGRSNLGLLINYKKSIFWYSRAAEHKSAYRGEVLFWLAYCYKNSRGANRDTEKAFKMFEALAKIDCSKIELPELAKFNAKANSSLADCYYRGIGTEKDFVKALAIWEEFAEKCKTEEYEDGCETDCRNLGIAYLDGKALSKDYQKAYNLSVLASLFGDISATNTLGWCYENGFGTEKNIKRAVEYYREAAECGNWIAKNNLKRLKKKGIITDNGE